MFIRLKKGETISSLLKVNYNKPKTVPHLIAFYLVNCQINNTFQALNFALTPETR